MKIVQKGVSGAWYFGSWSRSAAKGAAGSPGWPPERVVTRKFVEAIRLSTYSTPPPQNRFQIHLPGGNYDAGKSVAVGMFARVFASHEQATV